MIKLKKFEVLSRNDIEEIELPVKRVVCPRCDGNGSHVNPAIDGHGLSHEDFAQDPDFAEGYFSGRYDIPCEECDGRNVIDELDSEACKKKLSWWKGMLRFYKLEDERHAARAEAEAERRVGA